jgi:KUP system potassium uptake protein
MADGGWASHRMEHPPLLGSVFTLVILLGFLKVLKEVLQSRFPPLARILCVAAQPSDRKNLPLAVAALGVVFGDIGTSPLYAFQQCLAHGASREDIFGVVSLILWSLIILVSVKYVGLILRADNNGEGGILALLTLAFPEKVSPQARTTIVMTALGIFGAALLYGDGMITPAISVLSSVEGLTLISPIFQKVVVPATIGILVILFAVQRNGSGSVGKVFGSVMLLWFGVLAVLGVLQICKRPEILGALNPYVGIHYIAAHGGAAMVVLGSVFLAVTGGEALYADLGHFGRFPIQLAWNGLVLPSLALNYLGQGALVLSGPVGGKNPFFLLASGWALIPLVILSTAATVIASQALISGVFSLTMQAIQMGYLPRMQILHTNETASGQIYIPPVNYALAAACIALVLTFRSSAALAAAYGVAVTLTMLTTTGLFSFVCRGLWGWSLGRTIAVCSLFGLLESVFFASNVLKIVHGGWLPLTIGAILFYLMTTWKMGRQVVERDLYTVPLDQFVSSAISKQSPTAALPARVPGTAIFLSSSETAAPAALLQNVKHNHVLHERTVVLTVRTDLAPHRSRDSRVVVADFSNGIFQLTAHFGYMELPSIREIVECSARQSFPLDMDSASFFLSGLDLIPTAGRGLPAWRKGAFVLMSHNAQKAAQFFRLPSDRTVEIDSPVEI